MTSSLKTAFIALLVSACTGGGDADVSPSANQSSAYPRAINDAPGILVVAHRGGAAYAPENTELAFLNAHRLGVDAIELDVRLNASGDFVVVHDSDLARTANCAFSVATSQSVDLDGCDAAYRWYPALASGAPPGPLGGRQISVPLLRRALFAMDQFESHPVPFWVELKNASPYKQAVVDDTVNKLVQLLSERLWRTPIVLQSFEGATLSKFKMRYPSAQTLLLWSPNSNSANTCSAMVSDAIKWQIDMVGIPPLAMEVDDARQCVIEGRQSGLRVAGYTINTEEDLLRVLRLQFDAVITDYPACLQALLGKPLSSNPYPSELPLGELQPKCGR